MGIRERLATPFQLVTMYIHTFDTYELRSTDEIWYNATLQEISEILSHIQKHNLLRRMLNFPWVICSFIMYFIAVGSIMEFAIGFRYVKSSDHRPTEGVIEFSILSLVFLILFSFIAIVLTLKILYPDVEFALETPRYIRRKKIRKAIGWIIGTICTVVIFPYLTNLIM